MVTEARTLARARLAAEAPQLWRHAEAVGLEADRIAPALGQHAVELTMAGWLLDIGCAPDLAVTGFHPLDGARYLQADGWLPRVVGLVAHHCGAVYEAALHGLIGEVREFVDEASPTRDAVWYCDLVRDDDGAPVDPMQRAAELAGRHRAAGNADPRLIQQFHDELVGAVRRTQRLLRTARLA